MAGRCNKCGESWFSLPREGHKCPIDNVVKIPPHIWEQVINTANDCKKSWGMGFPVISVTLLKQILRRDEVDKPKRSIEKE